MQFLEHHDPRIFFRLEWSDLDPLYVEQLIELARAEDLEGAGLRMPAASPGDCTTALMPDARDGEAWLTARHDLVLSGMPLVQAVLDRYGDGCHAEVRHRDGEAVEAGARIAVLRGPASTLLQAERVLLNFLQLLSGIATGTARYVEALQPGKTRILDTRKTIPAYRALCKYATACGGGWNHRLGLFDRVMLKDNHLAVAGAVGDQRLFETVRRARETHPNTIIEVEVDRLQQVQPVVEAGAHIVLLDNFSDADLAAAVEQIDGRALTEASGGITLERLPRLRDIGLDFVSTGATVHQAHWADIGLDWPD